MMRSPHSSLKYDIQHRYSVTATVYFRVRYSSTMSTRVGWTKEESK